MGLCDEVALLPQLTVITTEYEEWTMEQGSLPRHAATVILTRDRAQGDMEVFLMRRHRDQAFMGGAFVFPGGSIDDDDSDGVVRWCPGASSSAQPGASARGARSADSAGAAFAAVATRPAGINGASAPTAGIVHEFLSVATGTTSDHRQAGSKDQKQGRFHSCKSKHT